VKSKATLTAFLLIPLGCGGNGGASSQTRDAALAGASGGQAGGASTQGGASSSWAGASGGRAGSSAGTTDPSGGQSGTTNAQGGTTSAQGGSTNAPAGGSTGRGGSGTIATAGTAAGGRSGTGGSGGNPTGGRATGGASGGSTGSGGSGGAQSGFVAYWDFESMTDNQVPEANGRSLPLTVDKGLLASGPSGKNLAMASAQASATTSALTMDASADFSISVWVKLDQLDTWDTFVSQDGQTISSFYLQKRDTHYLAFTTFPSDSTSAKACIAQSTLKPRTGEWYHLVATRHAASGDQRLYVDGVLAGKATCAGGFKSSGPLVLGRGRWDGPVDWITGAVDDLGVADRVLEADEIVDLYHQGRPEARHFLFAYFAEQAQGRGDGLRLAHSHDALYWGAIGGGKVFMPPTVGGKSFRDPHVMRDPTGTYHLVWTTSCVPWAESGCVQDRGFGHATSKDLATFSGATYITVALNAEHVWAPETIWDPASQQFMVYWSSPIDNDPSASDPHSIYYILTKDFVTFSDPKLLYGKSERDFIDATIVKQGEAYLMFLKDEANGQKNLRVLSSTSLFGSSAWASDPSAPLTGDYGAEGPSPLLVEGEMLLFFDKFAEGAYGALRSRTLDALTAPASWTDISGSVFFAGVRHGTAIEVPFDVFRTVALKAAE
jgi:hypothetical protein